MNTDSLVDVPPPEPGEVLVTTDVSGAEPLFPAVVHDQPWTARVIPAFRRQVAEAVARWLNATHERYPDGSARAYWQAEVLIIVNPAIADDGEIWHVAPDSDGRYAFGNHSWTWTVMPAVLEATPTPESADRATAEEHPRTTPPEKPTDDGMATSS